MIYGEGLKYSEDEFIEIDVAGDNDIIYYIYNDRYISTEKFNWSLFKKSSENEIFSIVTTGSVDSGIIQLNLNDYGLQFDDNKYQLQITMDRNGTLVGNTSFWYYYRIYTKSPKRTPWYTGSSYLQFTGGGGMGVMPVFKEKPFPVIKITSLKDDEKNIKDININIKEIIELNIII